MQNSVARGVTPYSMQNSVARGVTPYSMQNSVARGVTPYTMVQYAKLRSTWNISMLEKNRVHKEKNRIQWNTSTKYSFICVCMEKKYLKTYFLPIYEVLHKRMRKIYMSSGCIQYRTKKRTVQNKN